MCKSFAIGAAVAAALAAAAAVCLRRKARG